MLKKMMTCERCGAICDPADIRNFLCDDCREQIDRDLETRDKLERMLNMDYQQIRLENLWERL